VSSETPKSRWKVGPRSHRDSPMGYDLAGRGYSPGEGARRISGYRRSRRQGTRAVQLVNSEFSKSMEFHCIHPPSVLCRHVFFPYHANHSFSAIAFLHLARTLQHSWILPFVSSLSFSCPITVHSPLHVTHQSYHDFSKRDSNGRV